MQPVFGIVGWKNAGKTTLVEKLVACFTARGLTVSTIKHAHHDFDIDHPGKDSHKHREAGAAQVVIASDKRLAMLKENPKSTSPTVDDALRWIDPCDLVLIEGFKQHAHAKLEVMRGPSKLPLIASSDPTIKAVVTDNHLADLELPVFKGDDIDAIADFIFQEISLSAQVSG